MSKQQPELDKIEGTARMGGRVEALSVVEMQLLELFLSYAEQPVYRRSLTDVARGCGLYSSENFAEIPDRVVDQAVARLIRKTNALHPAFSLIRRMGRDVWIYSEVPPKKKPGAID